ncbi:MAG: YlxR family protein [Butyrivibrio sp.]|uniref:RNase P modulator RnpM n=1 Tax=Butyrivibrio sp. TaxID=28121 RepID=UPI001AFD87CF|nr:YlxR family protein [Butyrivibrio sp.]MBO6239272.1 YlxR family protein [Butyrivibrio sp.]
MQKKIPMRKCVGCMEMKEKKELIRVIKSQDGRVSLDLTGRANGRGAYICRSKDCLSKAFKNKGLEKSLKSQVPEEERLKLEKELSGIGF